MMGYPDSTAPRPPRDFGDRYVTVRASVRGAGASGGQIRAISPRTGMDGHEIIEQWIVKQPWSNGKVALHGHSWGGLTGLMIAATNPPHLSAVAVSGLFDDVYRDIG
jgi:putative CocE/NonD family hydrolase